MDQPTAAEALARLEPLVGEWDVVATPPGGDPWPGSTRISFTWHESGRHLVERATTEIPGVPNTVCIIGCDAVNGTYTQLYTDDRGVCRIYRMSIGDGEWRLEREGEPFAQRYAARFSDDGNTLTGRWEKAEDGVNFTTDFDIVFRKVGA